MHAITVILCACTALCAMFTLAEQIAATRFAPWAYRLGFASLRGPDGVAPARATLPPAGETEHGRFMQLGDGRVLVHSSQFLMLAILFERGVLSGPGRILPYVVGLAVMLVAWGALRIERASLLRAYHEMLQVASTGR